MKILPTIRRVPIMMLSALGLILCQNSSAQEQGFAATHVEQDAIDCSASPFVEQDGIVVVEVESASLANVTGWVKENSVAGATGSGYLRWNGSNNFNAPGVGVLEYKIRINTPGTYHFRWHNKVMEGTSKTDNNDSWLKIPDADDFYGLKNSSVKYPKGGMFIQSTTVTEGSSKNGWMKIYCSGTTSWTWSTRTSDSDAHEIYAVFNNPGIYTVQISGRSKNHGINRFVLFQESKYKVSAATQLSLSETTCTVAALAELAAMADLITVSPNPATEKMVITNTLPFDIDLVSITDLSGKSLHKLNTKIATGAEFSIGACNYNLSKGIYFLHFQNANYQRWSKEVVIY